MSGIDHMGAGQMGSEHIDEETIALLALGESVAGIDASHLHSCAACQSKVDQLRAVVDTARTLTDEYRPIVPPDDLWQSITDEIESDGAVFVARTRRSGLRSGWFALAAAVGVIVGSLGTIVAIDQRNPAPTIAQARLEPLPGQQARGIAQVRDTANGPMLMVDVPDLPQPDGYYEVWMLSPEADAMVSIGVLGSGAVNEFPLPSGMDMQAYPVVDISLEKFDGDVTHSGDSLARGTLTT